MTREARFSIGIRGGQFPPTPQPMVGDLSTTTTPWARFHASNRGALVEEITSNNSAVPFGHDRVEARMEAASTKTALEEPAAYTRSMSPATTSSNPRLNQPSRPEPDPDAFDAAELIEDFEHPICWNCLGATMVRDENGINMVTCDYCGGRAGRPAPE
jgi:hypothetical protein